MSPARLLALALPALLGCGWDLRAPRYRHAADTSPADAGADADARAAVADESPDASPDAGAADTSPADAGPDAAPDAGPDAPRVDTGPAPDAGPCERACGAGTACLRTDSNSDGEPFWQCCAPPPADGGFPGELECRALGLRYYALQAPASPARGACCADPLWCPHACAAGYDCVGRYGAGSHCCHETAAHACTPGLCGAGETCRVRVYATVTLASCCEG